MTRTAVAIRHVDFEDLGILAPLLEQHGFATSYLDAPAAKNEWLTLVKDGPLMIVVIATCLILGSQGLFSGFAAIHWTAQGFPSLLIAALNGVAAKLVYTTPSHQFPTGAVMTLERRQALLAWAQAANAPRSRSPEQAPVPAPPTPVCACAL